MITGLEAYRYYIPVKLHFTIDSFNVFETRKVKGTSEKVFQKRHDRYIFEKLSNKFNSPKDIIQYYVSNYAYKHDNFLYEPIQAELNYTLWNKRRESITRVFELDVIQISDNHMSVSDIFNAYINGDISIETCVILNDIYQISQYIPKVTSMLFQTDVLRIKKLNKFVKYDINRIKPYLEQLNSDILVQC